MKVVAVTKLLYKGKEYKSLKEVRDEIHNTIGIELLDAMQRTCPLQIHKDYDTLLNLLCSKKIREMLVDCLDTTFINVDEDGDETEINILDIK